MLDALGIHAPWLFAATVLVLNATPGVDLLFTLARTWQHGVRAGLAGALGIVSGCMVHTAAAALGLAALLAASAAAFNAIKWVGAAYLLWLAIGLWRDAARPAASAAAALETRAAPSSWTVFRQGLMTNALNPKVALFFLALLPQFIAAQAPHKTLAFMVLGAWLAVQSLVFLVVLVMLAAPLARQRPRPSVLRGAKRAGAVMFAGLALRLALAQR